MPKKVSVVIPVYNAVTSGGGYIHRCIQSLGQRNFDSSDIRDYLLLMMARRTVVGDKQSERINKENYYI